MCNELNWVGYLLNIGGGCLFGIVIGIILVERKKHREYLGWLHEAVDRHFRAEEVLEETIADLTLSNKVYQEECVRVHGKNDVRTRILLAHAHPDHQKQKTTDL